MIIGSDTLRKPSLTQLLSHMSLSAVSFFRSWGSNPQTHLVSMIFHTFIKYMFYMISRTRAPVGLCFLLVTLRKPSLTQLLSHMSLSAVSFFRSWGSNPQTHLVSMIFHTFIKYMFYMISRTRAPVGLCFLLVTYKGGYFVSLHLLRAKQPFSPGFSASNSIILVWPVTAISGSWQGRSLN